jgi:hypothetical protein
MAASSTAGSAARHGPLRGSSACSRECTYSVLTKQSRDAERSTGNGPTAAMFCAAVAKPPWARELSICRNSASNTSYAEDARVPSPAAERPCSRAPDMCGPRRALRRLWSGVELVHGRCYRVPSSGGWCYRRAGSRRAFWDAFGARALLTERRVRRVGVDRATRRWVTVRACRADCLGAR